MKKTIWAFAVVGLLLISCNKNQKAVKKLDGTWTATEMKTSTGSFSIDLMELGADMVVTFNACKLATDEWCDMSMTLTLFESTETASGIFQVIDDGKTIISKEHPDSSMFQELIIIELKKKTMKLKMPMEDNFTMDITATKN